MYSLNETGTRLTIDLNALGDNWQAIAARVAPATCAAVIKANAYGIGLEEAAKALWKKGARQFFVAHLGEALRARKALPDGAIVYALNGLPPGAASTCIAHNIRPVLGSVGEVGEWQANPSHTTHPCALHVDTGMNRLGVSADEAHVLAQQGFAPALVMSHLACADTPEHPQNRQQLCVFQKVRALFPQAQASLANSAASLGDKAYHFDLCRPGIALYGGKASTQAPALNPVVKLEARIIQIRHAQAGDAIGYGAAHHLQHNARLAIVSAGYADGILRILGASDAHSGGNASVSGQLCPIVGRISMDLIAIDTSAHPHLARGDWVTLIGDAIGLDAVALQANTLSYEILTSLSQRAHRVYSL